MWYNLLYFYMRFLVICNICLNKFFWEYHWNLCYTTNQVGHSTQDWQFGYFGHPSYFRYVVSPLEVSIGTMVAEESGGKEGLQSLCTYIFKETLILLPLSSWLKIRPDVQNFNMHNPNELINIQEYGFGIQSHIFFHPLHSSNIQLFQPSCFTSSSQISSVTFWAICFTAAGYVLNVSWI